LLIDRVIVDNETVEIRYVIPTAPAGEHAPFCHLRKDYFYVDTGRLPLRAVKDFDRAMLLREEADYRGSFAKTGADDVIANAERLIAQAKALAAT
jgi:hypothetical protein